MSSTFPTNARVVIIGGGIMGCSTAYHLAEMGCRDVVLLEQYQLSAGSTWHAIGAVGQLRSNANVVRMMRDSVDLYRSLEEKTGQATGWKEPGSLRLATSPERQKELELASVVARSFGIDYDFVTPKEVADMAPGVFVDDVICAAFVPSDGGVNPSDVTQALAKGARAGGVQIVEQVKVSEIVVRNGAAVGVKTDRGDIACEYVVNCAGIWAREIGKLAGVNVPLLPSHHQYIITDAVEGLAENMPQIRVPDTQSYIGKFGNGLALGGYESDPIPYDVSPIPLNHEFKLMEPLIEQFEPLMEASIHRFPALSTANVGVKQWYNGLESFTEDGMFILGEAPELRNFFVGAGFNAFGIASSGGAGKALAYWILNGEQPYDLWAADIRRFGPYTRSDEQNKVRSLRGQGGHYELHLPHEESTVCRGLRKSAIYDRLIDAGACMGAKFGWERPNWFNPGEKYPKDILSWGRQNWFEYSAAEHKACRERAVVWDQSSFSKFKIVGRDAVAALQHICAGDVDQPVGKIIYAPVLNSKGGIEADITLTRTGPQEYFLVTGTGTGVREHSYITRAVPENMDFHMIDVTSAYGVLSLFGPKARDILSQICETPLTSDVFPWGTAQQIIVAGAPALALRLGFVGELGWEIFIPTEYVVGVYDALKEAGKAHGLADAGYRALDTLRLEKSRRLWGVELNTGTTPLEAGLGFAVNMNKGDFIGRDALIRQKEEGIKQRFFAFTVDDPDLTLYGKETIYRNGENVGYLLYGGFGHTIGKPIGHGYVTNKAGVTRAWALEGDYELGLANERRVPLKIHGTMLYDPENKQLMA